MNYLQQWRKENPEFNDFGDDVIIRNLPKIEPERFGNMAPDEVATLATKDWGTMDALKGGFQSMVNSSGLTFDAFQGDLAEAQEGVDAAQKIDRTPQQVAFQQQLAEDDSDSWIGAAGNIASAIWDNPEGAWHEMVAQAPNMLPAVGGMVAGGKAGALAGSVLGPGGTVVGALVGSLAGSIAGATLVETGGIVQEKAQESGGLLTRGGLEEAKTEGAIKGSVIGTVDRIGLGVGKLLMSGPGKQATQAVYKSLADQGVDITSEAAIKAAMANPAVKKAASKAAAETLQAANTIAKRTGRNLLAAGAESAGEVIGEYGGDLAAGREASKQEALLEGFLSLPQSAVQVIQAKAQTEGAKSPDVVLSEALDAAKRASAEKFNASTNVDEMNAAAREMLDTDQAAREASTLSEPLYEPVQLKAGEMPEARKSGNMDGIDGLIIAANRMGFDTEAARLTNAKRLYVAYEKALAEGNPQQADKYLQMGNRIYQDVTGETGRLAPVRDQFPVPYVYQGEVSGTTDLAPSSRPNFTFSDAVDVDGTAVTVPTNRLQNQSQGKLESEGMIYGQRPPREFDPGPTTYDGVGQNIIDRMAARPLGIEATPGVQARSVSPRDMMQPATIWTGNQPEGYRTEQGAAQAKANLEAQQPALQWRVEDMPNGNYQVAGYDPSQQIAQEAAITATQDLAGSRQGLPPQAASVVEPETTADAPQAGVQSADATQAPAATTDTTPQRVEEPAGSEQGDTVTVQSDIRLKSNGNPFPTEKSAKASLPFRSNPGAQVVPVEGGHGVLVPPLSAIDDTALSAAIRGTNDAAKVAPLLDEGRRRWRETVDPEQDSYLGVNVSGDPVYQRESGDRYSLPSGGRPNFGGILEVVASDAVPGGENVSQGSQPASAPAAQEANDSAPALTANDRIAIAQRERSEKAKARRKIDTDKDSLLTAIIKLGGIKKEWMQDITGDTKNKMIPGVGWLFSDTTGTSPDDMASLLQQYGYLTEGEMNDIRDNGGVNRMIERISDELSGNRKHFVPESRAALLQMEQELLAEQEAQAESLRAGREAEYALIAEEYGDDVAARAREYDDWLDRQSDIYDQEIIEYEQQQSEIDETRAAASSRDEQLRESDGESRGDQSQDSETSERDGFQLNRESEAERQARERNDKEAVDRAAKLRKAEKDKAKKEDDAKATRQAADSSVNRFELGQDADQQLSGQDTLLSRSRNPGNTHNPTTIRAALEKAFPGVYAALENAGLARVITSDQLPPDVRNSDLLASIDTKARQVYGDDIATATWTMLAQNEAAFSLPTSDSKTVDGIFADVEGDGGMTVMENNAIARNESVDKAWTVRSKAGKNATILQRGKSVWIDVSDFDTGEDGKRVYNAVANYAFNNDLVFIGDPSGLSDIAVSRRLENMIASALKFGTTKHLWPHERQEAGGSGVPGIKWKDGDDAGNLRQMLMASYEATKNQYQKIEDLRYNPETDQFIDTATGEVWDESKFDDYAAEIRGLQDEGGEGSPSTAGRRTLERAVLTHTILRGTRQEQSSVLARLGQLGSKRLSGILYSRAEPHFSKDGRVLAYVQNGKVTFVADNIPKGHNVKGLMLHEIGVHLKQMGKNDKDFEAILKRLELSHRAGNKDARKAYSRALSAFGISSFPSQGVTQGVKADTIKRSDVLRATAAVKKIADDLGVVLGSSVGGGMNTGISQELSGIGRAAADRLADFLESGPVFAHSDGSINIEAFDTMLSLVRGSVKDFEILKSVVRFSPVDVVDVLFGRKGPSEMQRHDVSMFVDLNSVNVKKPVPDSIDAAIAIAVSVAQSARLAAKSSFSGINYSGRGIEDGGTPNTSALNSRSGGAVAVADGAGFGAEFGGGPVQIASAFDTLFGRHSVTPTSDVVLGGGDVQASSSPPIITREHFLEEMLGYYVEDAPSASLAQQVITWIKSKLKEWIRAVAKGRDLLLLTRWANTLTQDEAVMLATAAVRAAKDGAPEGSRDIKRSMADNERGDRSTSTPAPERSEALSASGMDSQGPDYVASVDQIHGVSDSAQLLAEELLDNGAQITSDGKVRVYHRTTEAAASSILNSGKVSGKEDGVFFSTLRDGQNTGYGDAVVELHIPLDRLQIDDAFGNEAHVRIATQKPGDAVDVKDWLNPNQSPRTEGAESPDTWDIRYSRAVDDSISAYDSLYESLGDKDKTVWNRAKQALRRELTPGGLLPETVFKAKLARDFDINGFEFDISNRLGHLEDAVKAVYGKSYDNLTEDQKVAVNNALSGEGVLDLDPAIREEVYKMRLVIKDLSKQYAAHLEKEIADLQAEGSPEAASKAALLETINNNLDTYVHRSYRAFDDPNWPKKVSREVVDDAARYLEDRYADGGEVTPEIQRKVAQTIELMLEEGTAFDSMEGFIKESKLGAKDLSVLQRRKQIAPEIRALLGEYQDAKINFTKSVTKMARLVMNQRFLDQVKAIGLEEGFLFTEENRPLNATRKIAADASEVYSPLNGLYTFPEIEQAFKDALGKEQMADWFRTIVRLNGLVKYGKTVLSPTTAMRNWMSAAFFAMANGHFDFTQMSKSLASIREYFTHGEGKDGYLRKMKRLGVIYDTPYAGEMMDLLADSNLENSLFNKKPFAGIRKANEYAQKFYQYGDDFWKILGFENEKAMLMKHMGMTEAQAEVEAAERIRNTYPTYSMTGRFVQRLRRFPLAGTFVSFPAEIVRTSYHILRYLKQDMKSNPAYAMRKVAGLAVASGMIHALQAVSMAMMGMDDDDEEAFRDLAPEWQRNSNLLALGRNDKGQIRLIDMSFLDPYNYWKRPINAIMRDQPVGDALRDSAREAFEPFFGQDIAFGAIMEAINNKKESGARVFNPHAPAMDQAQDIANHLRKALQPGIASNVERISMAARGEISASGKPFTMEDEAAALVGFRITTFDPKTAIYYRAFEFQDKKRDATSILSSVARNPNKVSDKAIAKAYQQAQETRYQAYEDMMSLVQAAMNAGLTRQEIVRALRNSGVSQKDTLALVAGRVPRWEPSTAMMRNAVKKAEVLFDPDIAAEFRRRDKLIRQQFMEDARR